MGTTNLDKLALQEINATTLKKGGVEITATAAELNVADGVASGSRLAPVGGYNDQEGIGQRFRLVWTAGQRGKPGINADILNASEAVRMIADPDFEVQGTNAVSASVSFNAEGGLTLTTAGADNDQVILVPHQDANQSAWKQVTWGTDQQVRWEALIKTGAAITNMIVWLGLKLTSTPVVATDDDQVFLRYQNGVNDGEWQAVSSVADTDDAHDTGVAVAADTVYHVVIVIDASRIARTYLNGTLVETSGALTDATDLVPFIGVAASGEAAAKALHVRAQAISRTYA